jgi:pimeloyl-ACP methyl ester carboxylesterase
MQYILSIIILLAAFYGYRRIVPSDFGFIGTLHDSAYEPTIYKEDFWPEHGYADLPHGRTHYYLVGPKDGRKVVFVHGILPTPPASKVMLEALAERGYRILCYEIYGRGYSDAPGVIYDDGLFVSQLANLLLYLRWGKTDIIGYSMGGAIACGFASRFPNEIDKIAFIAPAGLVKVANN